jgi:hypothetical protein
MNSQLITLISNIAIALSFIVGLVFGIFQVRAAARDRRERLTLETLRYFQTREFAEHLLFVSANKGPANWEEFQQTSEADKVTFIQFGQEMESLGLLVAERFINMDLVDKTLGSFVVTAWDKYKVLFNDIREKQPDPFLGEYFQWLAERIEERMQKCPRKPFHWKA